MIRAPSGAAALALAMGAGLLALAFSAGCGFVGEPLPPLLNIPERVSDLTVVERGANLVIRFTTPQVTTEGTVLKTPGRIELHAGAAPAGAWDTDRWAQSARLLRQAPADRKAIEMEVPVQDFVGREIVFGVRVFGSNERTAGWSNLVNIQVTPPVPKPADVRAESTAKGVRLTWQSPAASFRVYRRTGEEERSSEIGQVTTPEFLDASAEYGKTYRYRVLAMNAAGNNRAESDISEEASITPEDRFAPAVPAGLTVVTGNQSIELAWDRNSEPDFAGYRVYRSEAGTDFRLLGNTQTAPSLSDREITSGRVYRYSISAIDRSGNESARSEAVEVVAP